LKKKIRNILNLHRAKTQKPTKTQKPYRKTQIPKNPREEKLPGF
jgi:hypothetical protein